MRLNKCLDKNFLWFETHILTQFKLRSKICLRNNWLLFESRKLTKFQTEAQEFDFQCGVMQVSEFQTKANSYEDIF